MNEITHPPSLHADDEAKHERKHFGATAACIILAIACFALASMLVRRGSSLTEARTKADQASAALAQSKADLDGAKASASGLQTQLDAAKVQLNETKAKLDAAGTQSSASQARLTKLEGDESALKAQVTSSNTQSAQLQDQLSKAGDNAAALSKQLEQATGQTADLQNRLASAEAEVTKLHPLAVKARALPVTAAFEKAFWGGTYTMKISNQGPSALKIGIAVSGSTQAPVSTTIGQGQTYEVKDLQSGANLVVSSDGYDSTYLTAK